MAAIPTTSETNDDAAKRSKSEIISQLCDVCEILDNIQERIDDLCLCDHEIKLHEIVNQLECELGKIAFPESNQPQYDKYCHYLSEAQRKRNAAKNTMRSYRPGSHTNAAQLKREAAGLKQRAKRLKESEIRKGNEAARDWQEPTF